jgi:hypothetical protein
MVLPATEHYLCLCWPVGGFSQKWEWGGGEGRKVAIPDPAKSEMCSTLVFEQPRLVSVEVLERQ